MSKLMATIDPIPRSSDVYSCLFLIGAKERGVLMLGVEAGPSPLCAFAPAAQGARETIALWVIRNFLRWVMSA